MRSDVSDLLTRDFARLGTAVSVSMEYYYCYVLTLVVVLVALINIIISGQLAYRQHTTGARQIQTLL